MEISIMNNNGNNVVSSRIISQQLGKEQSNILRDIREKALLNFEEWIIPNKYTASNGQEYDEFLLTKDGFIMLVFNYQGYNDFKSAYINEFNRMEKELKANAPRTLKEALILALKQQEQIEQLELENKHLEITKAYISDKKTATAMNTASRLSKENTRLEIELDKSKEYSTIKRMELITGLKFNWRLLKSAGADLEIDSIKVFDSNYGNVKSYHKSVWMEAYALDINL
ncbi:MAG: Rha family transcriptional regulator [Cetobacterium sp.]